MTTRTPSERNPFKYPDELKGFPLLYRALIRPIREADQREGNQFLQRYYIGIHEMYELIADMIASVWDVHDPSTCPEDLLKYLKDIVGFDEDYEYITDRLSTADLRKLIQLAVPLWKERFSSLGLVNVIRLLTGRNAVLYDWFHWRAILGEVFLSEEQQGYDFWVIGGIITYFDEFYMQCRLMDDGGLDELLVLDLVELERVLSERIEVAVVDFLDQFDISRDKWLNLAGTPASLTTDKTFLVPAGTDEKALQACSTFSDQVVMHRFKLGTGSELLTRFCVYDWANGYYYEVSVKKDSVILKVYVYGASSTLGSKTTSAALGFSILEGLWYKLRVSAIQESSQLRIKVYIDGNSVFNVLDNIGAQLGEVVIGARATALEVDNVEAFRTPLRFATVEPSGVTQSANFVWDKVCPVVEAPPTDLVLYSKWDQGVSLDTDLLAFSTLEYEEATSFRLHMDYCRDGGFEYADDYNGAAIGSSGKFGSGCADLTAASNAYYLFTDTSSRGHNTLTTPQIGSVSFWVAPNYTGIPTLRVGFLSWGGANHTSTPQNRISVFHHDLANGGGIGVAFWDSTGTLIGAIVGASSWLPTSGQWYHIEVNWNLTAGAQTLFVDGVEIATGSLTGTRSTLNTDDMVVGAALNVTGGYSQVSDHFVDDLVIRDSVQHVTGETFTAPTKSIRERLASPYRLYYVSGGGCTLGHQESAVAALTRLSIDTMNQKVGTGALDLSNATTDIHLRHHGAGVIEDLGDVGTISFWVKIQNNTPGSENLFVAIHKRPFGTSGNQQRIAIHYTEAAGVGYLYANIALGNGSSWRNYGTAFPSLPTVGQWYHIEVAFDMAAPRLLVFIDGVKITDTTSGSTGSRGTGAEAIVIGNYTDGSNTFVQSVLDDLRIYNTIQHTANFTPSADELTFPPQ